MPLPRATRLAAVTDPEYHRHLMFGKADRVRETQLGRPLEAHEANSRLPLPQLEIVRRVERAVADRDGEILAVLMARQTGKNECEGFLEARALSIWRGIPGSVWVRTAPTLRPQLINSKLRLEKHLLNDPLVLGRWSKREGFIYESGGAQIQFLSGGPTANVVGGTASIALSVDEAHKIDCGKFQEDLAPFTASTNAPTVLWGVAGDKLDLLQEYREKNAGTDRLMVYPAEIWCELSRAYAGHYEARVKDLGEDHPVILTQYRLIAVDAMGAYLNALQRSALFNGDHPRLAAPRPGMSYGVVIDLGGESEAQFEDAEALLEEPGRDYTMAWIFEWDPRERPDEFERRSIRIVDGIWWIGRSHQAVLPELAAYCRRWNVSRGVSDARGVGEAVSLGLAKQVPAVQPYKATAPEVSSDCYGLLAWINAGKVKFWRGDPAQDQDLREVQAQALHTRYEIRNHDQMRLVKPKGTGSTGLHIDGIKALTYLPRAFGQQTHEGLMTWIRDRTQPAGDKRDA
jgi:hypothetical protein